MGPSYKGPNKSTIPVSGHTKSSNMVPFYKGPSNIPIKPVSKDFKNS